MTMSLTLVPEVGWLHAISIVYVVFPDQSLARRGKESGELAELRSTLLTFLRDSKFYQPQNLLTHFPDGKLC